MYSLYFRTTAVLLIGASAFALSYLTAIDNSTVAESLGSNYYVYTSDHYQQNRGEHAVTVLNFHADWCPSCSEFEPTLIEAVEESQTNKGVIGYRVPYGDESESRAGKELAEVYGVSIQTTTLILDREGEVFKSYFTPVEKGEVLGAIRAAALLDANES